MYTFPYEVKKIAEGELVDPRITLELFTVRGFLTIKFLIDSGADVTTLPIVPYAELFDFQKDLKKCVRIGGIEGKGVSAYPFTLTMKLGSQRFRVRSYFIESQVDPLLGRLDVWKLFSIHFDNRRGQTELNTIR